MTVLLDIIDGAAAKVTREGVELERIAHVTKLSGAPAGKILSAISAPGMPRLGTPHPTERRATLQGYDVDVIDPDNARVTLSYRTPAASTAIAAGAGGGILSIEINAQSFEEEVTRDVNGEVMRNSYYGSAYNANLGNYGLVFLDRLVRANVFKAQMIVRITYLRPTLEKSIATRFINSINAQRWSGYEPLTWLCTNLSIRQEDGEWIYTLEAAYRPETWRVHDTIEFNGQLPKDAALGNGIAEYEVYKRERWTELGVSF